ncbi:MAG: carboxypeptidase regulatory-like domain-containing protein [Bacteroidales bacterium]|nr:carboxypeptidase regulatory-like domain-containing protein [Bacteroidales bacterium]
MIKRLLLIMWIILTAHSLVFSQGTGSIQGSVRDKGTGETIPFANVAVMSSGGTVVTGGQTDFDGKYTIRAITPGTYTLQTSCIGYATLQLTGIVVGADKTVQQNIQLVSTTETLAPVIIEGYRVPVFEADQTSSGAIVTADEISKMPNRSAEGVVTSVSGVYSKDGEISSIRGTREGSQAMYVDGIRVSSLGGIPPAAYEQVALAISGISAQYGDVTSGVINVTTRGASRTFSGGAEVETSQFLDPYGYNRVGLNLTGPIWVKKNAETNTSRPIMGYFLTGDFIHRADGALSAIGYHRVNSETLDFLKKNPLKDNGTGFGGTVTNASYVSPSDIDHYKNSENTASFGINAMGRLSFQPTQNMDVALGGSYMYSNRRLSVWSNSLMNWENNPQRNGSTYRVFGRITQKFPSSGDTKSLFKNFYYFIQADYEQSQSTLRDERFDDKFFRYGYLGKFDISMEPSFSRKVLDEVGPYPVWVQDGYREYAVDFVPGTYNAELTNYTDFFTGERIFRNLDEIQMAGGLLNGELPDAVNSLWRAPGTPYNWYVDSKNSKWHINAIGSMDVGSHQVRLGFQYEQRTESYWELQPINLWTTMRQSANFHLLEMDLDNPYSPYYDDIKYADTIHYKRKYGDAQTTFDWNLRQALGLTPGGLDFIYIDSYDPNDRSFTYYDENNNRHRKSLGDKDLDLALFSPDDLLRGGYPVVHYYGFDYTGKKMSSRKPSLEDFFMKEVTQRDPVTGRTNTMYTREIAPYSPTYMGGWIEDKFTFNDIIFTLGLRVDGFDANQKVLKDNYLLYDSYTVGQLRGESDRERLLTGLKGYNIPENIGDDFVVYVNNVDNPSAITGYRKESTWYNAGGQVVNDPFAQDDAGGGAIAGSQGIAPYLVTKAAYENKKNIVAAFTDYKMTVNAMPRISFSFPISDEAVFFAHYDILTRRPSDIIMNPVTYLYFSELTGRNAINNPSLKPTQTIDYELGFRQKISNSSAISITAFYKEIRDEIQIYRYTGAYPNDYSSYNNIDFGTTKGLTIDYDLRRTNNARIRAGYTLQFASGTGSSPSTQAGLIAAQLPNLRTLIPMDVDRRHQFNLAFDYRFSDGKNYNGPTIDRSKKDKPPAQVLSNAGMSVQFTGGSGTPYTRQSNITSVISSGTKLLTGTINGSRLPWQFSLDAKVDKDFYFDMGKKKGGETRKGSLNVYLTCQNILDSRNIMGVYAFTGLPDDDGYLSAAQSQNEINSALDPTAFRRMYEIFINNPNNYSTPRTLRLGLIFGFF